MATSSSLTPASITKFFARLPDPRRRRTRVAHPLVNLVVMSLCGVIAGADTWEEIARFARMRRAWLAKFLDLRAGIPSPDPIRLAVPKAIVILRAGFAPSPELAQSILAFARSRLASYKRIRIVEFGELPKTLSGKIRRVELRQRENARKPGEAWTMEFREAE